MTPSMCILLLLLLLSPLRIISTRKLQTRALEPLRLHFPPRTPRHPPAPLKDLHLNRCHEALFAVIRPMPFRKRARKAKPTQFFWCMRLQLELVKVVVNRDFEGASGPVVPCTHERTQKVEIRDRERRDKIQIERRGAVAEQERGVVHDLPAREADAAVLGGVPGLHPHVRVGEAVCPVLLLVHSGVVLAPVSGESGAERRDGEGECSLGAERVDVPV